MPDPSDSRRHIAAEHSYARGWLTLDVVEEGGDWTLFGPVFELATEAGNALSRHERFRGHAPSEACISLSEAEAVRRLNAQHRGQDKATNVLSFPAAARSPMPEHERRHLGDIILAQEILAREAAELGIPPAHHFQHLVIHGLLHLLGFDHETDEDAEPMESLEIEILSSLGISNPYLAALEEGRLVALPSGESL